jgi:hypothetical protein
MAQSIRREQQARKTVTQETYYIDEKIFNSQPGKKIFLFFVHLNAKYVY